MAKQSGQKAKLLYLAQLLLREGDENRPISTQQLIQALEEQDIKAERKSIYRDMELLREFGMDVEFHKGRNAGWYLGQRDFQLPELKLLVDAVQSSRFISHKKSQELIAKLEGLTSREQAKQLRRQLYVDSRVKTDNETVYYTIDKIHAAISAGKPVSFQYFDYNVKKEKVLRREGKRYTVSPYGLIWMDENYYMVGWDHAKEGEPRHYRVDKMLDLTVINRPRRGMEECRELDLASYAKKHFHMFSGEDTQVRLRCENRLVSAMLDRFGQDVMLIPDGPDHFTLTVEAVVSSQFFGWLLGFTGGVQLTGPDSAVQAWKQCLREALGE